MPYGQLLAESRSTSAIAYDLRKFLRADGRAVDERWRHWARTVVDGPEMSTQLLVSLWREVLEFDTTLAEYVENPVPVGVSAVVVAGSGKESFKTFNVSTAASILAAASGAHVVKGVSHSVSAVSGSADMLDSLGLAMLSSPDRLSDTLQRDRLAFVSYSAFCPTYAGRYDGVFPFFGPFSFFLPIAVLAVRTSSFLYGIAHTNVLLAAEALRAVRPDLDHGLVVATELAEHELMDEQASCGTSYTANSTAERVQVFRGTHPPATDRWRSMVAHRSSHEENAELLVSSLSPTGCGACAELVERNAALILLASRWESLDEADALAGVRNVRMAGGALRLLQQLHTRNGGARCFTN
jgi:anthranilate phosphoribosyltransferase